MQKVRDQIKVVILETKMSRTNIKAFVNIEFTEFNAMNTRDAVKLTIIYDKIFDISFCNKY